METGTTMFQSLLCWTVFLTKIEQPRLNDIFDAFKLASKFYNFEDSCEL